MYVGCFASGFMAYSKQQLWERYKRYYCEFPEINLGLDISRMNFHDDWFSGMQSKISAAFEEMRQLEAGAIANRDENRMVGHYWLRNSALAPTAEIRNEIDKTVADIKQFAAEVHRGERKGSNGAFKNLLVIGIGGSALGPEFVAKALGNPAKDKVTVYFFDNTDPDGMDNTLSSIGERLGQTLCVVISKSGGTRETRNGMLEARAAYEKAGLEFGSHAVAVTGVNSELDKYAVTNRWLARFPMWDWVGGRTSELSAVGLLPAALQGIDIDQMLAGARACDEITRVPDWQRNPAARLALMWYYAGNGKGSRNMVVLPYKDRLELFSKYLQQLLMESLGKELDRAGNVVHQGITVLGNKGSTDQHSYIQQLREGLPNFFVTFIEVLKDRNGPSIFVDPGVTSGDYLIGFMLGTRQALYENERESLTITIKEVSPFSVGALIALFERAVGLYGSYINVNAYHQPGVEAGKKAASTIISLQRTILEFLQKANNNGFAVSDIAAGIGKADEAETVFLICEHLANNPGRGFERLAGSGPNSHRYRSA